MTTMQSPILCAIHGKFNYPMVLLPVGAGFEWFFEQYPGTWCPTDVTGPTIEAATLAAKRAWGKGFRVVTS